ncbi:putative membrane protein [Nocardia nova SH22a]|uniref:Putative membrane protein n=1 Tax=Nocardia nova SH22a TaxID=1415166 RepID=W5TK03_9NOCA|nr:DUF202 domain-containing protein [Nocardia nova]AHH19489.1 putative membrane protein [Nocardia nova SH22a]
MSAADPGLQPERTALSWTRTALAVAANALLAVGRDLLTEPDRWHPLTVAAAAFALVTALAVWSTGRGRTRKLADDAVPQRVSRPILVTGCATVALCLALLAAAV